MKNTFEKVNHHISQLNIGEQVKEKYSQSASKYFTECGCTMGGLFLLIALIISIVFHINSDTALFLSLKNLLFIFLSAVTGKLIGIGWARLRLLLLLDIVKNYKS